MRSFRAIEVSAYLLKFLLILTFIPIIQTELFSPFLIHSSYFTLDPWSSWIAESGSAKAFPYGAAMLLPLSIINFLITNLLSIFHIQQVTSVSIGVVLVFFDFLTYYFIKLSTDSRAAHVLWLFSPVAIVVPFLHGQLDGIPAALIFAALVGLKKPNWILSGIFLALAISAKWSMILVLPFVLLFIIGNKRYYKRSVPFLVSFLTSTALLWAPTFYSSGYRSMVLGTSESLRAFEYSVQIGNQMTVVIFPAVYGLLLYWMWNSGRSTISVLIAFSGAAYLALTLASPAGIGWYMWSLAFLIYFSSFKNFLYSFSLIIFQILIIFINLNSVSQTTSRFSYQIPDFRALNTLDGDVVNTAGLVLGVIVILKVLNNSLQHGDPLDLSRSALSVAISGDSGTGKDTLTESLTGFFGGTNSSIIFGDDYHLFERGDVMWNSQTHLSANANDLARMNRDVQEGLEYKTIVSSSYDHHSGKFTEPKERRPGDLLVVNGLHALLLPNVIRHFDLKIYLSMDENLRKFLKIRRDMSTRSASREKIIHTMSERAIDAVEFIHPQRNNSNLNFHLSSLDPERPESNLILKIIWKGSPLLGEFWNLLQIHSSCHSQWKLDENLQEEMELENLEEFSSETGRQILSAACPGIEEFIDVRENFPSGSKGIIAVISLIALIKSRSASRNMRLK